MANRWSYFDLDSMAEKKCKDPWGEVEDNSNVMEPSLFLFIILGIDN